MPATGRHALQLKLPHKIALNGLSPRGSRPSTGLGAPCLGGAASASIGRIAHVVASEALRLVLASSVLVLVCAGCSLVPDVKHKPQLINPFPQLRTIAVLPFSNQSEEPTLSGERVALAYSNELQAIRGFEVLPLGAVRAKLIEFRRPLASGEDFQDFARFLGVDAVLIGSITDYDPYYPPRMSMKVNWYAAHPGFHPVEPGYGLPWGTKAEKDIPRWVHQEAQRALAREQLATQTPILPNTGPIMPEDRPNNKSLQPSERMNSLQLDAGESGRGLPQHQNELRMDNVPLERTPAEELPATQDVTKATASVLRAGYDQQFELEQGYGEQGYMEQEEFSAFGDGLPENWPDPRGFIPDSPMENRPVFRPQVEPIISHMRNFNGHDEDLTEQLAEYFYYRDDARFGGWQAYLQRSEDFIRFCCYLHLYETLISRGGQDESRLILRWPIDRYFR